MMETCLDNIVNELIEGQKKKKNPLEELCEAGFCNVNMTIESTLGKKFIDVV